MSLLKKNRWLGIFSAVLMLFSGLVHAETNPSSLTDLSVDSFQRRKAPSGPRDPFSPGVAEGIDVSSLNLEGIIIGPYTVLCLVSGRILREGNLIGNFLVQRISPGEVILKTVEGEFILRMKNVLAKSDKKGSEYEIDFENADIKDALRMLSTAGNFNIIIPQGLGGRVSVTFHQTKIRHALGSILRVNNYEYAEENHIVRVGKPEDFAGDTYFQTTHVALRYATAKDLIDTVKPLMSDKGSIIADDRTNILAIKDRQSIIEDVRRLIITMDKKDIQVRIEAKIIDASKTFSRSIGIQWGFTKNTGQVQGFGASGAGTIPGSTNPVNVNLPAGNPTSGVGILIGNIIGSTDLEAQLTAAEERGDIHIISQPSVTTVNNAPAKIRSGVKIFVKSTSNITVGVPSGAGAGATSGLEEIDTGVELTVTPQITTGDIIKLRIEAVESEADFSRTVDGIPAVIDNTASTTVLVRDGETTVIGGLVKVKKAKTTRGVPGLSSIPIIGWLFKSKTRTKVDNELLIFITPRIVHQRPFATQTRRNAVEQRKDKKELAKKTDVPEVEEELPGEVDSIEEMEHEVIEPPPQPRKKDLIRSRIYTPKMRRR